MLPCEVREDQAVYGNGKNEFDPDSNFDLDKEQPQRIRIDPREERAAIKTKRSSRRFTARLNAVVEAAESIAINHGFSDANSPQLPIPVIFS